MIKLSDIIKSGGGNAKINRFINRYVLSKKEKKDIVNEIKQNGSSSGGSSIKYVPRYFSIDWDKCSDSWKYVLSNHYTIDEISYHTTLGFNATIKIYDNENYIISSGSGTNSIDEEIKAFSYLPVSIPDYMKEAFGVQYQMPFNINDLIEVINILISDVLGLNIELISMEGITEITEEEYYKID